MANNNISYNGFNTNVITLESATSITNGSLIYINANGKAAQSSNGQDFIGVSVCRRDNTISVQVSGYVECKYTGAAPAKNYARLKASASNTVTAAGNDEYGISKYKVLKVDETNKIVGFIL